MIDRGIQRPDEFADMIGRKVALLVQKRDWGAVGRCINEAMDAAAELDGDAAAIAAMDPTERERSTYLDTVPGIGNRICGQLAERGIETVAQFLAYVRDGAFPEIRWFRGTSLRRVKQALSDAGFRLQDASSAKAS